MSDVSDRPFGATWPDVALALIEWARADLISFGVVLVIVAGLVWLLVPRFHRLKVKQLGDALEADRRERNATKKPEDQE